MVDVCDSEVHDGPVQVDHAADREDGEVAGPAKARKRQPKRELRQLMIDAGRAILHEEGIETASNNLTFKRVFDRVERETGRHVTNASVIKRIWDNQSDFQADVLVEIAHDDQRPEVEATVNAVNEVLTSVDLTTPEGRLDGMSQLCRVAGRASRRAIADSTSWPLWISVVTIATTSQDPQRKERMCEALAEGYRSVTEYWTGVYAELTKYLGLRLRGPRTMLQFANAVSALSEGDSLRQHVTNETLLIDLPTGPGGDTQEWNLYGVTLEALALQFFEPDPDFLPS